MSNVPNRETFESAYAGRAPWDIDGPQKAIIEVADRIAGSILDAGCGTGENALFFAGRGHKVTGIDFLAEPIERARRKAAERGLEATFLVMDALALKDIPEVFDTAIDSGLFHVFDDGDRRRYVEGLASALKPGGRLFLLCFPTRSRGRRGHAGCRRREIEDAFAEGWEVESDRAIPVRGPHRPGGHPLQRGRPEGVVLGHSQGRLNRSPGVGTRAATFVASPTILSSVRPSRDPRSTASGSSSPRAVRP